MDEAKRIRARKYRLGSYYRMTPEKKAKETMWCSYYNVQSKIENIFGTNYIDLSHTREHTITFSYDLPDEEAMKIVRSYLKALRTAGHKFSELFDCVVHRQKGTGRLDVHITFFNVDSSKSDKVYREIISKFWTHGRFSFKRVRDIFKWISYLCNGLKPDSKNYPGKNARKHFASYKIPRTKKVKPGVELHVDDSDILSVRRHKHSSMATYTLKPDTKYYTIDDEGNKIPYEMKQELTYPKKE